MRFLFPAVFLSAPSAACIVLCSAVWVTAQDPDDPQVSQDLRYAVPPAVELLPGGAVEWTAAADCSTPAALNALLGARLVFTLDFDLDGTADAADSSGVSPGDCEDGQVLLRRTFFPAHPAVLRATLREGSGAGSMAAAVHTALTTEAGGLLAIDRYCARPAQGEPEWIEVRNRTEFYVGLDRVRLEGRVLSSVPSGVHSGRLAPGAGFTAGADTAELRLWQPGAELAALSSWSNLRNAGDTIRVALEDGTVLDSVIYGAGLYPREDCASLQAEGSGAAAAGYALEPSAAFWRRGAADVALDVRAPEAGRYTVRVYDPDGRMVCTPISNGAGPATFFLPGAACALLQRRAGPVILHLQPRGAPGVRTVFRIRE